MTCRDRPLRLLADDLTGALDSAAAFASSARPVAVMWKGDVPPTGAVAFDSGSREAPARAACARIKALTAPLWRSGLDAVLALKKIDSLLRGQAAAEIDVILRMLRPARCIVAPAFPAQGRITRGGRQWERTASGWSPVDCDLAAQLEAAGHTVARRRPGDDAPPGVSFWDAESDADLDTVVASAVGDKGVLWVGSGGLAAALARATQSQSQSYPAPLALPVLGLIGSRHAATCAQLARLGQLHIPLGDTDQTDQSDGVLARRLAEVGAVFATVHLPPGITQSRATAIIDARFAALLARLAPPRTLVVAGGETLRAVCEALGAHRLDVVGEVLPGVPCSVLQGGRWSGVTVVSKSGAFGSPDLLWQLAAAAPAILAGTAA